MSQKEGLDINMDLFCEITCIVFLSMIIVYSFAHILFFSIVSIWEEIHHKNHDNKEITYAFSKKRKIFAAIYNGIYRIVGRRLAKINFMPYKIFMYKHIFKMKIGKKFVIHSGTKIYKGKGISIGDGTIIGENVTLDGRGGLQIGKNVNFSSNAQVYTAQHDVNDPLFKGVTKEVIIENRSWISNSVIVLPGVHIKEGSVIAAGSVVTKDTEIFGVYAGIPAQKIKQRNKGIIYEFDGLTGIIS